MKDPLSYKIKKIIEWLLIQQVPAILVILFLIYYFIF
tara:strand:- start:13887 stop:13997 length:111 start_codon:yes stop_codon:yes gene_type:complete